MLSYFKLLKSYHGRGAVPICVVLRDGGEYVYAHLQCPLSGVGVRGSVDDRLHHGVQLITQEDGQNRGRRLLRAQTVIVACKGHGGPQKVLIFIHALDKGGQEQQELGILAGSGAGLKKVFAGVRTQGPVVMEFSRMISWSCWRSPPRFTASIIRFSVEIKGRYSRTVRFTIFSLTWSPSVTFAIRRRIASAQRKPSGRESLRLAESSSVRSSHWVLAVMVLIGTVRNVIDFGVFVDIGVHQDGLVHVSQVCDRFIKHPSEAVSVGDVVKVIVLEVDEKKKRISLSMKQAK